MRAQQPVPTAAPILPAYHAPVLALVQPVNGASVPQDRPVILFRIAAGESTDPVDLRSFAVSVDGLDRTAVFQVTRDMASGPLAPVPNGASPALAPGAHMVAARVCSVRGACSDVEATVIVTTPAARGVNDKVIESRKQTLIDLLLAIARKLFNP